MGNIYWDGYTVKRSIRSEETKYYVCYSLMDLPRDSVAETEP